MNLKVGWPRMRSELGLPVSLFFFFSGRPSAVSMNQYLQWRAGILARTRGTMRGDSMRDTRECLRMVHWKFSDTSEQRAAQSDHFNATPAGARSHGNA
jgi:hypothetical protein